MADPIRQLLSQTSYVADGSQTVWNFSFSGGYIDKSHVKAKYLDAARIEQQIAVTPGMFLGQYQLNITPPLAAGSELVIYRDTPKEGPLVDFIDAASLTEASLDLNAKQAVFVAAESSDGWTTIIEATNADRLQTGEDRTAARDSAANALTSEQIAIAAQLDVTTHWSDKLAEAAVQAGIATTGGDTATTQAGISTAQAGLAATAKTAAEAARDASFVTGPKYPTEAAGRVAVADGVNFLVQGSGDVAALEYRRTNSAASVLIASYPSAGAVAANKAKADAAPIVAPGKNLLNPALSSVGFILTGAGALSASAGWTTTGLIPVLPGVQVSISLQRYCAEYNEAQQFIAGTFFDPTVNAQRTFTTNAATKFLRLTHSNGTATAQVEYGAASTVFEAYKELVKTPNGGPLLANNTENVHPSLANAAADIIANRAYGEGAYLPKADVLLETNDLVKAVTVGTILNNSGALIAQAGWRTTDFIPVAESTTYTISRVRFLAFYDAAKAMIGPLVDVALANYTAASPVGAAYMRVTASESLTITANVGATLIAPITHLRAFAQKLLPELWAVLRGWMRSESYTVTSTIAYNAYGRPVSPLNIVWPDGCTGVLTITYNANGTVSAMTATHMLNSVVTTLTQPAITYANGVATQIPSILIS